MNVPTSPALVDPGWTPERIERAKLLRSEGHSYAEVAETLGFVSRNAVIGKMRRLGLMDGRRRPSERMRSGGHRPGRDEPTAQPAAPKGRPSAKGALSSAPEGVHGRMREPTPSPIPAPEPFVPRVVSDEPAPLRLALTELKERTCRWPYGERNFRFCGHKTPVGHVYCAFHTRLSRPEAA